jgi:hypothetical protein
MSPLTRIKADDGYDNGGYDNGCRGSLKCACNSCLARRDDVTGIRQEDKRGGAEYNAFTAVRFRKNQSRQHLQMCTGLFVNSIAIYWLYLTLDETLRGASLAPLSSVHVSLALVLPVLEYLEKLTEPNKEAITPLHSRDPSKQRDRTANNQYYLYGYDYLEYVYKRCEQ